MDATPTPAPAMSASEELAAAEAEFTKLAALKKRSRGQKFRAMQLGDRIPQLRLQVAMADRK